MAPAALHFTGDPEADALLAREPLALTIGFVLDQQVTVQKAFSSPLELSRRLGGLDAAAIAAMDPDELERVFRARPALHRFPANMAKRVREHVPDELEVVVCDLEPTRLIDAWEGADAALVVDLRNSTGANGRRSDKVWKL